MKYLVIFNFLVSISIVGYLTYKYFPFHIEVNKTFWCKKPYSITLWMRISGNRLTNYGSSIGLFTLSFRNEEKLRKWDSDTYHNDYIKRVKPK